MEDKVGWISGNQTLTNLESGSPMIFPVNRPSSPISLSVPRERSRFPKQMEMLELEEVKVSKDTKETEAEEKSGDESAGGAEIDKDEKEEEKIYAKENNLRVAISSVESGRKMSLSLSIRSNGSESSGSMIALDSNDPLVLLTLFHRCEKEMYVLLKYAVRRFRKVPVHNELLMKVLG